MTTGSLFSFQISYTQYVEPTCTNHWFCHIVSPNSRMFSGGAAELEKAKAGYLYECSIMFHKKNEGFFGQKSGNSSNPKLTVCHLDVAKNCGQPRLWFCRASVEACGRNCWTAWTTSSSSSRSRAAPCDRQETGGFCLRKSWWLDSIKLFCIIRTSSQAIEYKHKPTVSVVTFRCATFGCPFYFLQVVRLQLADVVKRLEELEVTMHVACLRCQLW